MVSFLTHSVAAINTTLICDNGHNDIWIPLYSLYLQCCQKSSGRSTLGPGGHRHPKSCPGRPNFFRVFYA